MATPSFPGVFVEEVSGGIKPIEGVSTSTVAFVGATFAGPLHQPTKINSFQEYENYFGPLVATSEMSYSVMQFFANGGRIAWIIRVPNPPSPSEDLRISANDLAILGSVKEALNLLCLPGITDSSSLSEAVACCDARNMFFIADVPQSAKPSDVEAALSNSAFPRTKSGAAYYPWIKIPDPLTNNQPRLSAPSGTIAGVYARMDNNRGVWKAPAGQEASLKDVLSLNEAVTETEMSKLSSLGVNTLRSFPGSGPVVWGARTLLGDDQSNSEYKYIPVRRLAIYIESSIREGIQWAVFEPNDESLWVRLRRVIWSFLLSLFQAGAFQGSKPEQAFFVKCDRDTMTQNDIDQGMVNILVGFASIKPAEFVILRISQKAKS